MNNIFDLWKLLAGVSVFLLGMRLLEDALKQLSGRSFKLFLKKQTAHKVRAVAAGAVVTGILQSSSVVNLMVLAFVGAGIMGMNNALAVMLGANLGTTLSSWIVATVGFKVNIEAYALPLVGIAGIMVTLFRQDSKWKVWSSFLLGMGLLFVGLDFMKTSVASAVAFYDVSSFSNYHVIFFLFAGILLTSIIQSSSATVAIVLSLLHVNAITLYAATAIVLGSEVGTTVKLLIASAGGSAIKKRVALGNFLFNTISITIVFIFLSPVNKLIIEVIGIRNQLIALSFFQTFVNLVAIVFFFPFLNVFGNFLSSRFKEEEHLTTYIHKVSVADAELAIGAMEKETAAYLHYVLFFCSKVLHIDRTNTAVNINHGFAGKPLMGQYEYIKHLHGDMYEYYIALQKEVNLKEDTARLDALSSSVRNSMYAAKSMKDAHADVEQLRNSSSEIKYHVYQEATLLVTGFYAQLDEVLNSDKLLHFEGLVNLYRSVQERYGKILEGLYRDGSIHTLSEVEISTIINFYRELQASIKALAVAAKALLLPPETALHFDELPMLAL